METSQEEEFRLLSSYADLIVEKSHEPKKINFIIYMDTRDEILDFRHDQIKLLISHLTKLIEE